MAAIPHGTLEQNTAQTRSTDSFATPTGGSIAAGTFTAAHTYLIIAHAQATVATFQRGAVRLVHGTTAFPGSTKNWLPDSSGVMEDWAFMTVFTQPGSAELIAYQHMTGEGGINITSDTIVIQWVDLTDLDAAHWEYDEDTSVTQHTTTPADRASVTITATANDEDWLVLATTNITIDSTSIQAEARVNLDSGADVDLLHNEEGNNTADNLVMTMARVYRLASGSHTFTVQTRDQTTGSNDHNFSAIFAIRLTGVFVDAGQWSWTLADDGTSPYSSLTWTPSVAGDVLLIGQGRFNADGAGRTARLNFDVDGTDQQTGKASNQDARSKDTNDQINVFLSRMENLSAASHTVAVEGAVSAGPGFGANSLVAWNMELDAGAVSGTAAITLSAATVAASGAETITGTAAITLPSVTVAASGVETFTGTAASILPAVTVAATGDVVTVLASGDVILPAATVAASGAITITGTAAATLPSVTVDASGTVINPVTGEASVTLGAVQVAASGTETITGTVDVTLPAVTVSASGVETITGTAATVLPSATVSADGLVAQNVTGAAAVALSAVVATTTGHSDVPLEHQLVATALPPPSTRPGVSLPTPAGRRSVVL